MKNKIFAKNISAMTGFDQETRKKALETGERVYNYIVYLADQLHNYKIKSMIEQYGYPTQEKVGEDAMQDFWLLIQHQDFDTELQEQCLEKCDFNNKNKAYLTDRIRVNKGEKQLYGTQFFKNKVGERALRPIEDEDNVDKRRKEMDLEPIDEYVKKFLDKHK